MTREKVQNICLSRFSGSPAIPAERGRDQQVLEPLGVIPLPIEPFRRAPQLGSLSNRPRAHGGEVVDQRPTSQPLFSLRRSAVQMLRAVQTVVEPSQEPVHRVARPMAAGMGVCLDERVSLVAQRQDLLSHDRLVEMLRSPLPQTAKPLRGRAGIGSVVRTPDSLPRASKVSFRCLARSRIFGNAWRKQRINVTPLKSVRQAACVAAQPSVLTVWGRYSGSRSRASSRNTP